jgi:hypothetical protein
MERRGTGRPETVGSLPKIRGHPDGTAFDDTLTELPGSAVPEPFPHWEATGNLPSRRAGQLAVKSQFAYGSTAGIERGQWHGSLAKRALWASRA